MKKILLIILASILTILVLVYTLLFTSLGNNLLKPTVQSKINENSPIKVELSEFMLNMSELKVLLKLDEDNTVLAYGTYSPFSLDFDIEYKVKLTKLENLSKLAKRDLSGKFLTDGAVKGNLNLFKIKGHSDLAKSDTNYSIVIKEKQVNKAAIKLLDLNIETLLSMLGEKAYAKGKIDLHTQVTDLNPKSLKGNISLDLKQAKLNKKILKNEFGINISKTSLEGHIQATLEKDTVDYFVVLNSELAKLLSTGKVNIDKKSINSTYLINLKELALLKSITDLPLRGSFFTSGKIDGNEKELSVKGNTNIALSKTTYDIKLKDLKPSKVLLNMKDARLSKLLYMAGQSNFAKAKINADIEFNDLSAKNMDGQAIINITDGKINQKIMKKEFDITLPKTSFALKATTTLKPKNINYKLNLVSNLAKIHSKGKVNPSSLKTDASYDINIKELALLKPITNAPLRGPFSAKGNIVGNKIELDVIGISNIAASDTVYKLNLTNLKPKSLKLSVKNASLTKLLYLAGEPSYAKGKVNLNVNLSDITPLNGKVKLSVLDAVAFKAPIKKAFDINLPYTKFKLNSNIDIKNDFAVAKSTLDSNLAVLSMNKTSFNIKTTELKTDYKVYIPSLKNLEPILERKLNGKVTATGDITKNKKLTITAHSNIFNGKLNAKIVDEKVNADFTNLHALKVLKMMGYPEVMDAPVNGTLVYNTKTRIGKLNTKFDKATLTKSKMTDLIGSFTRTDLTKERFNEGSLISDINKDLIKSTLKMKSSKASLNSKKFLINTKKQLIDAKFTVQVKKYAGDVLVTRSLNSPKVEVDFNSLLKNPETQKKIGKELDRLFKKLF